MENTNFSNNMSLDEILKILNLTENDYKMLVLELKRCSIMNKVPIREYTRGGEKKHQAIMQLTVHITKENPDVFSVDKPEGEERVNFDTPIKPEDLKRKINESYNSVKSDIDMSEESIEDIRNDALKINSMEDELEKTLEQLERNPLFRIKRKEKLESHIEYLKFRMKNSDRKLNEKIEHNEKVRHAVEKKDIRVAQERDLRNLAEETKSVLKNGFGRESDETVRENNNSFFKGEDLFSGR